VVHDRGLTRRRETATADVDHDLQRRFCVSVMFVSVSNCS